MKDAGSVALGAVLALVGTVLVQSLLVPRAQRRIRQRERWEKDVLELVDVLVRTLPPAIFEYHTAKLALPSYRATRAITQATTDKSPSEESLQQLLGDRYRYEAALRQQMNLVSVLVARLQYLNDDAEEWTEVRHRYNAVMAAWGDFCSVAEIRASTRMSS